MISATAAQATRPVPRPGVLDIQAYVPGKSTAPPGVKLIKLSSNETPLGPSPHAIAAFKDALTRCREAETRLATVMEEGGWLQ